MPQTVKLCAFLVANQFDIKGIKTFLDIKPLADSSSELFYFFDGQKFQYYFNFGVVVFSGYSEDEMKWAIKTVQPFQRNPVVPPLRDDHSISASPGNELRFGFDELILDKIDDKVIRITM